MITERPEGITRSCDCSGCTSKASVTKWPSGSYDSAGYFRAVGPRQGSARMGYDVCPGCAAAGKLPPLAENPQPFPLQRA